MAQRNRQETSRLKAKSSQRDCIRRDKRSLESLFTPLNSLELESAVVHGYVFLPLPLLLVFYIAYFDDPHVPNDPIFHSR